MKSLDGLIRHSTLGLVALLLLAFSLLVYLGGETLLHRYVDGRLFDLAARLAQLIEQRRDLLVKSGEDLVPLGESGSTEEERHGLREVAHSVLIFSADGKLVLKGSDVGLRPPLTEGLMERVRPGEPLFETIRLPDGTNVRRVSIPILREGALRYILQAEESLLFVEKTLTGLMLLLAVGSGAVVVMAWLGSGWLARKILLPIHALSASAETMSGSDLGTRLMLDSPFGEFRRLTQAFNAMMDRFQRACESQRRFVDYAAHEMQTPLTILEGNLEVTLQRARTPEEYRDALLGNLEQVERLITLTRSLLMLTKLAGDRPAVHLEPLSLDPLIRHLVSELMILADDHRITLTHDLHPVPSVPADAGWLNQALINLLDNALRYTSAGGAVTVRLRVAGDHVTIAIEDTGQGIEAVHIPRLFERFYRTDHARARDSGGTGLGLSIVKEIVEAHNGFVTVDSQVGKGSTFTIWLPLPATV
ncbi:sensor histidine kinase [Nitrospira sp. Nam74]